MNCVFMTIPFLHVLVEALAFPSFFSTIFAERRSIILGIYERFRYSAPAGYCHTSVNVEMQSLELRIFRKLKW